MIAPKDVRQATRPVISVLKSPDPGASQTSQVLRGELCRVFEERNGYALVQLHRDGYRGYCETAALSMDVAEATHWVSVPATVIYPKPDLKSHPVEFLTMNAQVQVFAVEGSYAAVRGGGFIFQNHLHPIGAHHSDFVAVAELFLNTPYYWGGRSVHGLDCSGLVQLSLHACGVAAARDSGEQEKELGTPLSNHDNLQRGDLVFWPGHVGMMQSATQLIHANGHFMNVTSEPLADVIQRTDKPISHINRLAH